VRRASLADPSCPIARTLDVVGEWWSLLILRDALFGARRFEDFKTSGIADNILTVRLKRLVAADVLERRLYQVRPERYEYVLTTKGSALAPVIAALRSWGTAWTSGDDTSPRLVHATCGNEASIGIACGHCGQLLASQEIQLEAARGGGVRPDRRNAETRVRARHPDS
jgi:DNA-binding HxlR family transcriptional regulator